MQAEVISQIGVGSGALFLSNRSYIRNFSTKTWYRGCWFL